MLETTLRTLYLNISGYPIPTTSTPGTLYLGTLHLSNLSKYPTPVYLLRTLPPSTIYHLPAPLRVPFTG